MVVQLTVLLIAIASQAATPESILSRYVQALGGEAALRAVTSRTTEGAFDNGRGLRTRFRIVEQAPNRKVTVIGTEPLDGPTGSGRGFDGSHGWDKSFIGTGLRALEGRELADAARDADLLRPLHLLDGCATTTVESAATHDAIVCNGSGGEIIRHSFDRRSGLLIAQEINAGPRRLRISFDDYRNVDGVKLPFKTHIDVGGATIQYQASAIQLNIPVNDSAFRQPRQ